MKPGRLFIVIVSLFFGGVGAQGKAKPAEPVRCASLTMRNFEEQKIAWKGRELIGFASWCASCQSKIAAAQKRPERYVVLAVFDEIPAVEAALSRLSVKSPCITGEALQQHFAIRELPWSVKL